MNGRRLCGVGAFVRSSSIWLLICIPPPIVIIAIKDKGATAQPPVKVKEELMRRALNRIHTHHHRPARSPSMWHSVTFLLL